MALQGQVAPVTGATGIVGEGIAHAFLEEGATVVAPIRSAGKEAAPRWWLPSAVLARRRRCGRRWAPRLQSAWTPR
jgi:NAD(P)-dependent dehydrogenase (short-subunit alcohol dehydrogenase family)